MNPVTYRGMCSNSGMPFTGSEVEDWTCQCPSTWNKDLTEYCQGINNQSGIKEQKYQNLLNSINTYLDNSATMEVDWKNIWQKFNIINQEMPTEIKTKGKIAKTIFAINSKFFIESSKGQISITDDIDELTKYEKDISEFTEILDSEFEAELRDKLNACKRVCYHKMSIASFAKAHDIILNPQQGTVRKTLKKISDEEREPKKHVYSILSIDGGGIRGVIPARVLVEFEKITRMPISNLFNLIGGTSTGGILALGLTAPDQRNAPKYTAQAMLDMYTIEHSSIFKKRIPEIPIPSDLNWKENILEKLRNPRYEDPSNFFAAKLGTTRLSNALTDVLITTNSFASILTKASYVSGSYFVNLASLLSDNPRMISHESPGLGKEVHYFTKEGLKVVNYGLTELEGSIFERFSPLRSIRRQPLPYPKPKVAMNRIFDSAFAAQATSAAPTFFPIIGIGGKVYLDGGILQNNPALPCLFESLTKVSSRENLFMLSLGTGEEVSSYAIDSRPSLAKLWFETVDNKSRTETILKDHLGSEAYHRFQYRFADSRQPDLDDTTAINTLVDAGQALVEEQVDIIRMIAKLLVPGCI